MWLEKFVAGDGARDGYRVVCVMDAIMRHWLSAELT